MLVYEKFSNLNRWKKHIGMICFVNKMRVDMLNRATRVEASLSTIKKFKHTHLWYSADYNAYFFDENEKVI